MSIEKLIKKTDPDIERFREKLFLGSAEDLARFHEKRFNGKLTAILRNGKAIGYDIEEKKRKHDDFKE